MIGRTLSHYKVLEKIGEGGMGEVYLAKDTKLDREVAIKVLPAAFSENKERLARFEREARLLASLNHPNIAAIHELEESDGVHFLALEYVPGETLAERIKRERIPIDEALPLFKQIAEGLEAAHEKGVIHRDLKPANIKITPEGKAKVLDFGLAKAMGGAAATQELSESPTITRDATEAGVLLGTAPYMSPEQARGKPVDKRTDIWAFGCCLYEALTGKAAYHGDTVTDTLARIVEREPNWDVLPATTPALARSLIRRCLQKDSIRRLHDIADARIEIEEALAEPLEEETAVDEPDPRVLRPWALAALFVGLIAGGLAVHLATRPEPAPIHEPKRLNIYLPQSFPIVDYQSASVGLVLSPDGTRVVYAGNSADGRQLFMRPIDSLDVTPISGTEGGYSPFFSPDGQWLGFGARGKLWRVSVKGGDPLAVCDAKGIRGASWGEDGIIVFNAGPQGLSHVSAEGGTPEVLTKLEGQEYSHRWPQILPGRQAVLLSTMTQMAREEERTIAVVSLDTGEMKILVQGATYPRYAPTGHLLFARAGSIFAAPFDLNRLELTGSPEPVLHDVRMGPTSGFAFYSISPTGSLVYVPGYPRPVDYTLVWVNRSGKVEPLTEDQRPYSSVSLSSDGSRLAVGIRETTERSDLWAFDLNRRTWTRLTFTGDSISPIWTPDGERIAFVSIDEDGSERVSKESIFWTVAEGSGSPELLVKGSDLDLDYIYLSSFSPDGKVISLANQKAPVDWDIWTVQLGNHPETSSLVISPHFDSYGIFSPNGKHIAHQSSESGRAEVYVRSYPKLDRKWTVSTDGGGAPLWSRNGKELFYRNGDKVYVVPVQTEPEFEARKPRLLFDVPHMRRSSIIRRYDVMPDGQRFVMIQEPEKAVGPLQIVYIPDWFEELKRLVPNN